MHGKYQIWSLDVGKTEKQTLRLRYSDPDNFGKKAKEFVKGAVSNEDTDLSRYDKEKYTVLKSVVQKECEPGKKKPYYKVITDHVVDLENNKNTARRLIRGFRVAKEAARLGTELFIKIENDQLKKLIVKQLFNDKELKDATYKNDITNTFKKTYQGLNSPIVTLSDNAGRAGKNTDGYVIGNRIFMNSHDKSIKPSSSNEMGSIHVNFAKCSDYTINYIARAILHEATHKHANTKDNFGPVKDNYHGIDKTICINEADVYALSGMSLFINKLVNNNFFKNAKRKVKWLPTKPNATFIKKGVINK